MERQKDEGNTHTPEEVSMFVCMCGWVLDLSPCPHLYHPLHLVVRALLYLEGGVTVGAEHVDNHMMHMS